MGIEPETIRQAWINFWYGLSIPFQLFDLFLPDEWEIAIWVIVALSAIVAGIIIYVRKNFYI